MSTVMMAHASQSETGSKNGTKGDSTGKEVCTRTWYSKPWDWMAIFPDATVRETIADTAEAAADNDNVGYGQSDRNTLNTEAKKVSYDISKIVTKCNCDCSSLANVSVVAAGKGAYGSNGWTTSTLKAQLQALGAVIITDSTYLTSSAYCVKGAIYCKEGSHCAMGLTNGSKYATTLSKAGIAISSSSGSSSSSTSSTPTYKTGTVYTTKVECLNVRKGPGTKYAKLSKSELTTNAQANSNSKGQLNKGTKVTCKGTSTDSSGNIWMKIPSGYIAAYYSSKKYVG